MPNLKVIRGTPASLGYSFPPEWHPHAGTWFSWPRPEGISFPGKYHTVPEQLARIIREIATREAVHINVPNENYERIVRAQLEQHGCPTRNVHFHFIKTNESWCRDHGPAFLVRASKAAAPKPERKSAPLAAKSAASNQQLATSNSSLAVVDWGFNAWGGKYPPYVDDDSVPTEIAAELGYPMFIPDGPGAPAWPTTRCTRERVEERRKFSVVMEGGSVDFNGAGTVLTTTDCLLNKNRNPHLSKKQIEQYLKDFYGQRHVCWLTGGIVGDDTDGHIDDLARFIDPRTIVIGVEDNPKDANYKTLKRVRKQLDALRDQDGQPFEIVEIPMPGVVKHDGERLPATYVNFYFVNGALLVPTYRHKKNDRRAIEILQAHLPKHKVIGVDCVELIWGLGAIHCLTQQMPK